LAKTVPFQFNKYTTCSKFSSDIPKLDNTSYFVKKMIKKVFNILSNYQGKEQNQNS
jgi:hypothetical protein